MKVSEIGVLAEQMMDSRLKDSYKIFSTDKMVCEKCGHEVLRTAINQLPIKEHFESDYDEYAKKCKLKFY
jgi:hypothetical protein